MSRKEIQADVNLRLARGDSKTTTFKALQGRGVRDAALANMIAAYVDPARTAAHATPIRVLIGITWLQLVVGMVLMFVISVRWGWVTATLLSAALGAAVYVFVWGFQRHRAWVYNVSILLSVLNMHQHFKDFGESPVLNSALLGAALGTLGLTFYLRVKLFPDFVFMTPKKVRGAYTFST